MISKALINLFPAVIHKKLKEKKKATQVWFNLELTGEESSDCSIHGLY